MAIIIPIRYFLVQPFFVRGASMEPTFEDGEYLLIDQLSYRFREPRRGEVIVFRFPQDESQYFIKRIIGLPGDLLKMQDGLVYVNGEPIDEPYVQELCRTVTCRDREWQLGEDEFFVLGDNRNASQDSHDFGPINREQIVGKAWVRYWPPSSWALIDDHHHYEPPQNLPTPTITPTDPPGDIPGGI